MVKVILFELGLVLFKVISFSPDNYGPWKANFRENSLKLNNIKIEIIKEYAYSNFNIFTVQSYLVINFERRNSRAKKMLRKSRKELRDFYWKTHKVSHKAQETKSRVHLFKVAQKSLNFILCI